MTREFAILPTDPLSYAASPTMYFIGVTTHQSAIMKVFPHWATVLGLADARLLGVNFPRHDQPDHYRRLIEFIKHDPRSRGALVTTHKLDVVAACRDLFDELDEHAHRLNEVSSVFKRNDRLIGSAKDPVTSGIALNAFLAADYWQRNPADVLIFGAGGSSAAISWHLLTQTTPGNAPRRLVITNRSQPRLDELAALHRGLSSTISCEYHLTPSTAIADELLSQLAPGSLIINATGLGKDAPGSPLSDDARWPLRAIAWDFNYRGDLGFLAQARAQQVARQLQIQDGWVYFILGWTQVIADVFNIPIATSGPQFDQLSQIASALR